MIAVARNERAVSERQIGLCEKDSRLGFHSEAEAHQFHPEYLRWRIARLDEAVGQIELLASVRGERAACLEARHHLPWYLRGVAYSASYRAALTHVETLADIRKLAREMKRDLA